MDHDQRFKTLIQTFFDDFLQLFFKQWAERFDAESVEWLTQEVFPGPPDGARRLLDLVGKLRVRQPPPGSPEQWLALVHIEIESPDWANPLKPRMFETYVHLRRQYRLPVLPIGILLRVGLDGIGIEVYEEHYWDMRLVRFEYLYVGLPALDALEYVQGDNWLGVALAALMKIPRERAAWLGAEALRRIQGAPLSDQRRFLLGDCVQAYLPLDETQQREFERLVTSPGYAGVQAMNKTSYDKGMEVGIERGFEKGKRAVVREDLLDRFGSVPAAVLEKVEQLPLDQLQSLRKAIWKASSLADLGLTD